MGAWRRVGPAVAFAGLLLATRAAASTVMEPIARLSLEGGYDSNVLYDGASANSVQRISPELGLRLHDPLWSLRATYGGEWVRFGRLEPNGIWNHRGGLALDATPTRRTTLAANLNLSQAFDPAGLAGVGVFRAGRINALVVNGRGRLAWREERRVETAATMNERTVRFQDGSGGAMHAPGAEALWLFERRLSLGAAYAFGAFQSFNRGAPDQIAYSNGLRARARWEAERHVAVDAYAGPSLWTPQGKASAVVPEALVEALVATRGLDLRLSAGHGLGLGATAQPGLVDFLELGGERRFGRTWLVRGSGGVWRSGAAPTGAYAVVGYAAAAEAGVRFGDVLVSLAVAHYGRAQDPANTFERNTVGVRMSWELPVR